MTGVVFFQTALGVKRLELLHELLPATKVMAYLVNPRNVEGEQETKDVQAGARVLGIELHVLRATSEGEIDPAFAELRERKVSGVLIASDPFFFGRRNQVAQLSAKLAMPVVATGREYVAAGNLASYGTAYQTPIGKWACMPARYSRVPAPPIFLWCNPPGSSWSSTSRPR